MEPELGAKFEHLLAVLRGYESVLVCFSGGLDSAFVLKAATMALGDRAVGLTAASPSLPASERNDARTLALELGVRHFLVDSAELARPGYANNGPDRCFHCKSELYEIAEVKRAELGLAVIANGTNLDDLGDYRPGLEAARLASAKSPLVEAELTKDEVRRIAHALGLPVWDKPAAACLSSRIPYGVEVTRERLAQVEAAEAGLLGLGFRQVRVRYHHEVARIELPEVDLARAVENASELERICKAAGFRYATLDLGGYRMGSLNEALPSRRLRVMS